MILVLVETDAAACRRGLSGDVDVRTVAVRRGRRRRDRRRGRRRRAADALRRALAARRQRGAPRHRRRLRALRRRRLGRRGARRTRGRAGSVVVTAAGTPAATRSWRTWPRGSTYRWPPTSSSFPGSSPFTVTRQVLGGAALEEMRLGQPAGAVHRRRPRGRGCRRPPSAGRRHGRSRSRSRSPRPTSSPASLRRPARGRRVRLPEVRPRRRRRRPWRRWSRRVQRRDELAELLGGVARRLPRRHQPRLATAPRAGRPDRQPDLPGHLHPVRHLRRHPALGRLLGSKMILAINTDAEAPMMTKATYAVVGDMHEVVPAINEEIRQRKG